MRSQKRFTRGNARPAHRPRADASGLGHSGYAEEGSDIVCAAVTSAVRLCECTINDVLGLGAHVKVNENTAALKAKRGE